MKIAMLTSFFYPHLGGTEKYVEDLSIALQKRGHSVTIFTHTPSKNGRDDSHKGVDIHRIPSLWGQYQPIATFFDYKELANYDVVHSHLPPYIFTRRMSRYLSGQPHVATYHCDIEINEKYWFFRIPKWFVRLLNSYFTWLAERALVGCDRIIVTSQSYGAESPVIPKFDADVIPVGVDPLLFEEAARRIEPTIKPRRPERLLYVGRLVPSKGVETLIEAVAHLRAMGRSVELTIVGVGDYYAALKRMVKSLDLADKVTFSGRLSFDDLVRAYSEASMLVLPSVLRLEAFGIVQLEALTLGTPVIASNLPGVREIVERTGGGYIFERGNAADLAAKIDSAMADWEGTLRRGAAGRGYVYSHYSWDVIAEQFERVYIEAGKKSLPVYAKPRSRLLRALES